MSDESKPTLIGFGISAFGGQLKISELPDFSGISIALENTETCDRASVIIHRAGIHVLRKALSELRVDSKNPESSGQVAVAVARQVAEAPAMPVSPPSQAAPAGGENT